MHTCIYTYLQIHVHSLTSTKNTFNINENKGKKKELGKERITANDTAKNTLFPS